MNGFKDQIWRCRVLPADRHLASSIAQKVENGSDLALLCLHGHSRMATHELSYCCGNQACRCHLAKANAQFAAARIGEEFDLFHALPEFIEHAEAAFE